MTVPTIAGEKTGQGGTTELGGQTVNKAGTGRNGGSDQPFLTKVYGWTSSTRVILVTFTLLQIIWFAAIGLTGANTRWDKLQFLILYSVACCVSVNLLSDKLINKLNGWKSWLLEKDGRVIWFLGVLSLVVGIFYGLYQRVWQDEKAILAVAKLIADQGVGGILIGYSKINWLRYQHPPLFPLVYGLAMSLVGNHMFLIRQISVLFMSATLIVTYLLGRELYGKETGLLASILLFTFPLVIRLGTVMMMDMQLTLFFSLALLLILRLIRTGAKGIASYRQSVLIGVIIGLGLLTKYIMIFFFGVLFFYWLFEPSFRKIWLHLFIMSIVSMSILGGWLGYASRNGILGGQVQRILEFSSLYHLLNNALESPEASVEEVQRSPESNLSQVIENTIGKLRNETIVTRLPSSIGVYHYPLIFLSGLMFLRRRNYPDRLILLWMSVVVVALLVTLPDHRYFMAIFPAIAIMIGNYLERSPRLSMRVVILSLLFVGGAMYLFVDWMRESHLFLPF